MGNTKPPPRDAHFTIRCMTARAFCWTLYNTDDHERTLELLGTIPHHRYSIFQFEKCPSTDNTHFQGYSEFSGAVRPSSLKRVLGRELHVEFRRETRDRARNYCRKDDTRLAGPWELGEWIGGPGHRSDIISLKRRLDLGESERSIAQDDEHFGTWLRYNRGIRRYINFRVQPRNFKTEVAILWGQPGTGKTRRVFESHKPEHIYVVPRGQGGQIWFDGYEQQPVILIDDFYGWIKWSLMLNIMDRYHLKLPVKGGFVEFTSKVCYITSNSRWQDWYNTAENPMMNVRAFERRIDYIEYFGHVFGDPEEDEGLLI